MNYKTSKPFYKYNKIYIIPYFYHYDITDKCRIALCTSTCCNHRKKANIYVFEIVVMILNATEEFALRAKQIKKLKPAFVQNYVVAGGGSAVVLAGLAPGVVELNVPGIST